MSCCHTSKEPESPSHGFWLFVPWLFSLHHDNNQKRKEEPEDVQPEKRIKQRVSEFFLDLGSSKAAERATRWTFRWACSANFCFEGQQLTLTPNFCVKLVLKSTRQPSDHSWTPPPVKSPGDFSSFNTIQSHQTTETLLHVVLVHWVIVSSAMDYRR